MIDLAIATQNLLDKSSKQSIAGWLMSLPKSAAWHLISDYVFECPNRNDAVAFTLLLHHEKLHKIIEYINEIAPTDIKNSRQASQGLIRYIKSPVAFNFVFVLKPGDRFLKDYSKAKEMIAGLEDLGDFARLVDSEPGPNFEYFLGAQKRIKDFARDLEQRGNEKVARQIFLVATLAAVVMDYLDQAAEPKMLSWVSDRDAILKRHDGAIWDIASLLLYSFKTKRLSSTERERVEIKSPKLFHVSPEEQGDNELDALIRMPDYLAAAASGLNLDSLEFSHKKLHDIGTSCFAPNQNTILCTISWSGHGFLVRRIALQRL